MFISALVQSIIRCSQVSFGPIPMNDIMGPTTKITLVSYRASYQIVFLSNLQFLVWMKNIHPWQMMRVGWCSTGSIGDEVKTRLSPAFANLGQRSLTQPWETLAIMLPHHSQSHDTSRHSRATLLIGSIHKKRGSKWSRNVPAHGCNCATDVPKQQRRWSKGAA